MLALQVLVFPSYLSLSRPLSQTLANAQTLIQPAAYCREMKDQLALEKRRNQLPSLSQVIGRQTVDVFGNYQSAAFLNT